MSRASVHDNSNAVSLFPFLAVLLCTMGALLVVLVAVARMSRDQALQQAAARKTPKSSANLAEDAAEDDRRRKLQDVTAYIAKLEQVRAQAEQKLRDDQARLSHLEEHMRRLQDQLESSRLAAAEMNAMEEEHYDDRVQAEREVARLQQLIDESRSTIEELRAEMRSKSRSYAIVPYEGASGTHRRPMYIECRKNEVVLQPEGIRLTEEDFRPPIGPGNPLAAALRAGREYLMREGSTAGSGGDAEPYPLILVRPDGIVAYYRVREAIESWDAEFGYELIDGDWELKFPPANPQIAAVEYQAVELARGRMKALAAAAPRAYGAHRSPRGAFDFDPSDHGIGGSGGTLGSGAGHDHAIGSFADGPHSSDAGGEFFVAASGGGDSSEDGTSGTGQRGNGSDATDGHAGGNTELAAAGSGNGGAPDADHNREGAANDDVNAAMAGSSGQTSRQSHDGSAAVRTTAAAAGPAGESSAGAAGATASTASASSTSSAQSAMAGRSAATHDENDPPPAVSANLHDDRRTEFSQRAEAKVRGLNWAIRNADPGSIPIRRTIQVVVRADRLAILPERASAGEQAAAGREVPLTHPVDRAYEQFMSGVEAQIQEWGMAGRGLYWRPVLEMTVGPDGQQSAAELARRLKNSGIELRSATVAKQDKGSESNATR